jgi:hypothetical protein
MINDGDSGGVDAERDDVRGNCGAQFAAAALSDCRFVTAWNHRLFTFCQSLMKKL